MGRIQVRANIGGLPQVQAAYRDFKDQYINRLVKSGAQKAGRKTVWPVKSDTQKNDRTGQLSKSRGMKYKFYKSSNVWVVLVGARAGYRAVHPFWGIIDPTRYDHIVEGGRKMVVAGTRTGFRNGISTKKKTGATVLAMKVKRLKPGQRSAKNGNLPQMLHLKLLIPPKGRPGSRQGRGTPASLSRRVHQILYRQFGMKFQVRRGKKVPGGYIVFAKFAKATKGTKPVERNEPYFAKTAENEIVWELKVGIPRILAKYGSKVYK